MLPASELIAVEVESDERSLLQAAILATDEPRVHALVAEGVPVSEGLVAAARMGSVPILELLIANGAETEGFFGARALAVSLLVESEAAERLLRANGAHLEAPDEAGRTILVWASGQKKLGPLVRTAISAGADLEAASRTGETALMTACRKDRASVVRMLLNAGAEIDARDRDGWTPLMFALRAQSTKLVSLLVEAGADLEAESNLGWTPLMMAAWEGKAKIVNRLLRAGADPEHRTAMEYKPLVRAIQGGHVAVVRRLLAHGADVGVGKPGDPLWWARKLGRRRLGKLLVAAGESAR
jgi:ankyrin repeat protein